MTRALGRSAFFLLLGAWGVAPSAGLHAQVPAEAVIRGRALLGDSMLRSGTVVLHRVSEAEQGEVDSARVAADGSFRLRLPGVPDPKRSEVYFASVRHAGVLYFGKAVTLAVQLDSLYEIQTYDTVMAPVEGVDLTVKGRSIFLERGEGDRWQATDLFEVTNDRVGTLVARAGGVIWSHPLPEGAQNAQVSQTEVLSGAAEVRAGKLVVVSPLPPGERMFVVRYTVPTPFLSVPIPGRTEAMEILVREPAPALESTELQAGEPAQLDEGATFRRLMGSGLRGTVVRVVEGRPPARPPARWMAVVLAFLLAGVGLWAVRSGAGMASAGASGVRTPDRSALILEVARLDEAFASRRATATPEERGAYEARRREMLRRLGATG